MGHNIDYFVSLVHWEDRVQEVAGVVQYEKKYKTLLHQNLSTKVISIAFHV